MFSLWYMVKGSDETGREKDRRTKSNVRTFVIRSRPVTRVVLRPRLSPVRGILSPASSRSVSSESEGSPCPRQKKVRWVDEERAGGCVVCQAGSGKNEVDLLGTGMEMEKVD